MKIRFFFILLIFFYSGCKSPDPNPVKVNLPDGTKVGNPDKNLMVTISADNKIYIGSKELPPGDLDSTLGAAIDKKKMHYSDSITVLISTDTATSYGIVFNVLKAAKKKGAKVVARVN